MHVCTHVSVHTCVCMGCGAGEKHLLFSAELCCGLDPAHQRRLLSIIGLNCLPGMSYALMPADFNPFRWPGVRGLPFSGKAQILISVVAS